MPGRNRNLQHFIDAAEAGIEARAADYPAAMVPAGRIFSALKAPGAANAGSVPARLPVCGHLETAYSQARNGSDPMPALADAFAAIEPALAWDRRQDTTRNGGEFYDNHANAVIVGQGGLEVRDDVRIGVSLVAPGIDYPRHRHPPEELYVVLSPGRWMQNDNPLALKQSGDLVHNPPNVWHAMQSAELPLLAIWCLWLGD